jgi:hypothetical protein
VNGKPLKYLLAAAILLSVTAASLSDEVRDRLSPPKESASVTAAAKPLTIQVKGATWTYRCLSNEEYKKEHSDSPDSCAMTIPDSRRMDFKKERMTKYAILDVRHELLHAYVTEIFIRATNASTGDVEEVCAEIFSYHADEMIKQAEEMAKKLRRKKK